MTFRRLIALIVLSLAAISGAAPPPVTSGRKLVSIDVRAEVALAFAQDGYEVLLLQPVYMTTDTTVRSIPKVAWVFAVPSAPVDRAIISDSVLARAWEWIGGISARGEAADDQPIDVEMPAWPFAPPVDGRYEFTVLPPASRTGANLTGWLHSNGFAAISPPISSRPMPGPDGRFVVVTVRPPVHRAGLPPSGVLRPIRIAFRSDRVVYPVRLAAGGGPFPATLFVASGSAVNAADAGVFGMAPVGTRLGTYGVRPRAPAGGSDRGDARRGVVPS